MRRLRDAWFAPLSAGAAGGGATRTSTGASSPSPNTAASPLARVASPATWASLMAIAPPSTFRSASSTIRWAILRFVFLMTSGASFVGTWSSTTIPCP